MWLVTYKKAADPARYLSYDDIVEEALAYGWVDSLPRALDEQRSMRLVAPRRPKSSWSAVNKARIAKLIAAKQLAAPGRAAVERAKADGSWTALDEVETLTPPADLLRAFRDHPGSAHFFDAFPKSSKRLILEWINSAKTATTREKRIDETARLAAENQRAHHWRNG